MNELTRALFNDPTFTGADFLLDFFTLAVAAMRKGEREQHFLELALEEIGRLEQ